MLKRKSLKKKKKPEPEEVPDLLQEGLPQVWLAVTPEQEIDHLQNAGSQGELKSKKKVVIKESDQDPQQGGYLHDDILEPQEVTAIGWEDEEELDYTKIAGQDSNTPGLPVLPVVQKSSVQTTDMTNFQRRPSGISSEGGSLFSYAQTTSYQVKCMGEVEKVSNDWINEDDPQSVLKLIEMAQHHGDIPWMSDVTFSTTRTLIISKYGVKVTDEKKQRVFGRLPLHNIVNVIHYTSIHHAPMLVLRVLKEGSSESSTTDLYLYECQSNEQASDICVTLGQAFDAVMNKMKMDENLLMN